MMIENQLTTHTNYIFSDPVKMKNEAFALMVYKYKIQSVLETKNKNIGF